MYKYLIEMSYVDVDEIYEEITKISWVDAVLYLPGLDGEHFCHFNACHDGQKGRGVDIQ